ncbi:MAG: hypothetical protein I8H71_01470 [Xanthomonadaceae bacterium]|nr:hypothetical protein [Xanthomonadaceae bacterium]
MSKQLAGARWFEAQGRRAFSQGKALDWQRHQRNYWPMWARCAWARGWIQQGNGRQLTEMIVQSFEDEAQRTGCSLRATVDAFLNETPVPSPAEATP